MRKIFILLVMLAVSVSITRAQITIGKIGDTPEKGVYLDLNPKGVTLGGLLLPNVIITNVDSIPTDLFGSFTPAERDSYPGLKGMVVYNTNPLMKKGSGEGIYVWDGDKWNLSGADNIFTSTCTSASTVPAAGGSLSCAVTDPNCVNGGAYNFNFIAGAEFTRLEVTDASAGAFTLHFETNDRASERSIILMVMSPCGNSQTLFYTQKGDITDCDLSASNPKIMAENNVKSLCSGGAVYLYLDGNPSGRYIWTLNGEEVGRGNQLIAVRTGKYIVYANKIGCTVYEPDTLTVTAGSTGAPNKVSLTAGQNGFVCSATDKVKLFATSVSSGTVHWYKNGRRTALAGLSIDAEIGQWFAVVESGQCVSLPSDPVTVQLDPNAGSGLINNFSFTINGATPTAGVPLNLCAGGTLNMAVTPVQSGVDYTWYNNTTIIGQGASITYSLAGIGSSFVLRCRATKPNACAVETATETSIAIGSAPARPTITINNPSDALCGGSAILTANAGGSVSSYVWYYSKDNISYSQLPDTKQILAITQTGYYKVAAASGNCLSEQSVEKNIAQSSGIADISIDGPATGINPGDLRTYTARMNYPQGAQYSWSISDAGTTGAKIQGPANGNSVIIGFSAAGTATLSLSATNACGDASPKPATYKVTVTPSCTDAFISPAEGAPNQVVSLLSGQTMSLSVNAGGSPTLTYQWYKGSSLINGESSGTFTKNSVSTGDAGNYYCRVISSCNGSIAKSATFAVSVLQDPSTMLLGNGSLTGRTCFDIVETERGSLCGTLSSRMPTKADFATLSNVDKTYTFTAQSSDVRNVRFVVVDREECVASTSSLTPNGTGALSNGSKVTLTVNYKTTLNQANSIPKIQGRSRDNAAEVMIYVVYTNSSSQEVAIPLRVTIQDCTCCGAMVSATTWKVFMCHNLGADQSVDPFTPTDKTNGAYYQWGRKDEAKPAPDAFGNDQRNIPWNSATPQGWFGNNTNASNITAKSQYDPCPSGFRVPSYDEWLGVYNNNTRTVMGSWSSNGTNCSSCWGGVKLGDGLMLPLAGDRNTSDGVLYLRSYNGIYWTNRRESATHARGFFVSPYTGGFGEPMFRNFGRSIRCIAE